MKRTLCAVVAASFVTACGSGTGGNPFEETSDTVASGVPDSISSGLESITVETATNTITVRGIALDDSPIDAVYARAPALDRPGYEAYTNQSGSLRRHSTAYVGEVDGARAVVVATGGQFQYYFGGALYDRTSGSFEEPDVNTPNSGQFTYAGTYVGLLNAPGSGEDLLPVAPGTPSEVLPVQAAEVTGNVIINADFADDQVNGLVFNRVADGIDISADPDLELAPTAIDPTTGSFEGEVTQNLQGRGDYGGIFAGTDSSAVAGGLFVSDHIQGVENEEEYGIFVLSRCGTPNEDPICNQPNR